MTANTAQLPEWAVHPSWYLVIALPWPEDAHDGIAESAFAVSPMVTVKMRPAGPDGELVPLSDNAYELFMTARDYADDRNKRVVFASDVTMWLTDTGNRTWKGIGIDFVDAMNEIANQAGLYLALDQSEHFIIYSAARRLIEYSPSGVRVVPPEEREQVRRMLEGVLDRDWPDYIAHVAHVSSAA